MIKINFRKSHQILHVHVQHDRLGTVSELLMIDTVELCGIVDDDDYSRHRGHETTRGPQFDAYLDRGTTAKFCQRSVELINKT